VAGALAQTLVFAIGAVDPAADPYALLYRWLVRPRLRPPGERVLQRTRRTS
jgi:hypothetical protein